MSAETTCEMCGAPAYNCNGRGELIGRHTDIEECLRRLAARVAALEQRQKQVEKSAAEILDNVEATNRTLDAALGRSR